MMKTLGKSLSKARKAKNLTQEQLSELSGVSLSHLSRLERDICSPTIETLIALCDVLEVGVDDMLYDYLSSNTAIQNPNLKQIMLLIKSMDAKHYKYIKELLTIYRASHQE